MADITAKEIRCPKTSDHTHKKILLVLGDDYLSVYCREHGWMKIELKKDGKNINFEGVTSKITSHGKNTNFVLSSIPGIAIGKFQSKRKKYDSKYTKV